LHDQVASRMGHHWRLDNARYYPP